MWNPFKAIGNAVGKALGGIGKGLSKAGQGLSKAGEKISTPKAPASTPKAPPAPAPPKAPASTPKAAPAPVKTPTPRPAKLPPPTVGPITGGHDRDEKVLGVDSDQERALIDAVKEFEADFGTGGLHKDALSFIDHPSLSAIFDKYAGPSGFSSEQWLAGMQTVPKIKITRDGLGGIDIVFDADFEIDDYDLGGRTVSASF